MSSIDSSVWRAKASIHYDADYAAWVALGQNFELAKFANTPVAFRAGYDAGHARAIAARVEMIDSLRKELRGVKLLLNEAIETGTIGGFSPEELRAEVERLRGLASTCYAGLGAECNLPDAWLDTFLAAAEGKPFETEGLLPFTLREERSE